MAAILSGLTGLCVAAAVLEQAVGEERFRDGAGLAAGLTAAGLMLEAALALLGA